MALITNSINKMASAECSEDCNRLVFEAVNESSITKFKLVKQTFSEIEVLTSLIQCNEKGETPLEIAMKGENVSLIDELVMVMQLCDREISKCHEMSLFAIEQLFHHQIPIIELIEHLVKQSYENYINRVCHSEWLDFLAQVVFKSTSLSRPNKITALELIGASLLKYDDFRSSFAVMFRCWREAMTLRYFPAHGEPLLPKIPYVGVASVASSVVFGSAMEVMSMEELNLLHEHFERDVVPVVYLSLADLAVRERCIDLLKRHSLLVNRRISSQANHGHPHWFYLQSLYEFGKGKIEDCDGYAIDNFVHCAVDVKILINTFLLILEQMTGFEPKLLPRQSFNIYIKSLGFVSHWLGYMAMVPSGGPVREELSFANLLALTKFIGTIAKFFPTPAMMSAIKFYGQHFDDFDELINLMEGMMYSYFNDSCGFAEIIFNLVLVLEYISPQLNNQERQLLEDYLSNYIRNYFLERTTSVLHAGVRDVLKLRDNLKPIKLMIKLGADPNAINKYGETPLHLLARFVDSDEYLPVFQALVHAGAHLDMAADNNETVLDILKRNLKLCKERGVIDDDSSFSSLINTAFPLSCYCARVIRRHGIQFDEDRLPLHLREFFSRHNAKGSIDLHQRRDN